MPSRPQSPGSSSSGGSSPTSLLPPRAVTLKALVLVGLATGSAVVNNLLTDGLTIRPVIALGLLPLLFAWLARRQRSRFWAAVWTISTASMPIHFSISVNLPLVTGSGPLGQQLLAAVSFLALALFSVVMMLGMRQEASAPTAAHDSASCPGYPTRTD